MKHKKIVFRFVFLILFKLLTAASLYSQISEAALLNKLTNLSADDLTEQEIEDIFLQLRESGMSFNQLEVRAITAGVPLTEVNKLKKRMEDYLRVQNLSDEKQNGRTGKEAGNGLRPPEKSPDAKTDGNISADLTATGPIVQRNEKFVFGQGLFTRENLSFAPNLNLPTPENYILGTGDEIIIEVYGASQKSYALKINADGWIRIPELGPLYLKGLSIEAAKKRLGNRLASIYSGLKPPDPNTWLTIGLGEIRSIQINVAGEANLTGSFSLPSLSTVYNALYLANGPNTNGSYRNIKLIRNNKIISTIDLYEFLLKGLAKNNLVLQDQDIIFIEPWSGRVEITGEVKRPAIYELNKEESLEDILYYAGGFSQEAYKQSISLKRNTSTQRKIMDIEADEYSRLILQNGDFIEVGKILSRFENRVSIRGAVFREGDFELSEDMNLKGLLEKAQGFREDAYLKHVSLYRLTPEHKIKTLSLDLSTDSLHNSLNLKLQKEDLIYISSIFDLEEEQRLSISGEVQNPGEYPYFRGMDLAQLIRQAGGLKESASHARIEVARRLKNADAIEKNSEIAGVFSFSIDADLYLQGESESFILEPNDIVFVRRSPGYEIQQLVSIEGEVNFPGEYSLKNNQERISDLITRAGGLTRESYADGATLFRKKEKTASESNEMVRKQVESELSDTVGTYSLVNEQAIGIDLPGILKNPGSPEDLFLKEGDKLEIPTELQTVKISGALLYPVTVKYEKMKNMRYYIANAGGFTENARKNKTFIVYANGSVDKTRSFIGVNNFPEVEPGAEIVVPRKPEKEKISAQQAISTSSAIASLALVIVSLIGRF